MAIEAARLALIVEGDTSHAERKLDSVSGKFDRVGQRLQQAGRSISTAGAKMTRGLTSTIVGAGAAIVGVGQQFESTMSRITGLVGIPADEVERLGESVLDLAPKVGKGPDELAEALFFVTSAGLRGAEAMEVLEASAKASAAGLGETKTVADAVTSAMNAYGAEALPASKATDVLTAAVREGKLEASQLAPVLGRLLPTASAMGIQFEDVAGTLAVFSRTGADAAEGATSLQAIMSTLQKPSKEAAETLDAAGLSMGQLRDMAAGPGGLVKVMRTLEETLGDDEEALAKVIPNVRAFRGVMNVLAQDAETVDDVLGGVADSAGVTDEAFQAAEETTRLKFDKAMAQAQKTLISISAKVLPAVSDALEDLSDLLETATDWWENQSDGTQQAIVKAVAFTAALGPLLWVGGKLVTMIGTMVTVTKAIATSKIVAAAAAKTYTAAQWLLNAALTANPIGLVIAALALLAAGLVIAYKKSETFREIVGRAFEAVMDGAKRLAANVIGGIRLLVDAFLSFAETMIGAASKAFGWVPGLGDKLDTAHQAIKGFREDANAELNAMQTNIRYSADVTPAMREIRALRDAMRSIPQAATVQFGGTRGGVVMHAGGWVPGPASAEVPALLQGGEFVVSHDMMKQGAATPGGGGGTTVVQVKIGDRELDEIVVEGQRARSRRGQVSAVVR